MTGATLRDFHQPGRSPAYATGAMAATSHPLATATALDVLRRGGNAVDATIAAVAVLGVVEPHMTGIGGDCFAILSDKDGKLTGLNGSGRAPMAASLDRLLEEGVTEIGPDSVHAVTVPGAVAAWQKLLTEHGTWSLADALAPAIAYAEDGFPVTPRVGADWAGEASRLARDKGAAKHFLVDGAAPTVGSVHRLPALAETLRRIAEEGPKGFYEGPVAEEIVATLAARGGWMRLDDLAAIEPTAEVPITSDYRGYTVAELPPNGQGLTALILLNILQHFDLDDLDPLGPERFHLEMEAARIAYACRDAYIADPAAMTETVEALLAPRYSERLADTIDPGRRGERPAASDLVPDADTVYLTVVDRDRRAISLINSVYHGFGSGIVTEKSGIALQNRGACFVVEKGHPNTIDAGKRPMHTIIPGFVLKDGAPFMSFGVMGGAYQPCGHAHFLTNMIDYGMDVQAALDFPRLFWDDANGPLSAETTIPEATLEGLAARGHEVTMAESPHGGGQAIRMDGNVLIGGSDPRKDGCALGF
ncbi:gamma-glutamyltransferase [Rhodobium gokarnense]|uniref:Glutathione hydrolase proenzyme n=1 Tax=Rhodobium gokarnense TaxID=364296 RepID=A0ABT3HHK5_9HYPH|nr:gamma-glutamyltransferase [Rhodobium gokarnense]MCW2309895.1 gamma-glutamyltranspeptidase/glutathione hydrolase [Rhodobium gokarnense]